MNLHSRIHRLNNFTSNNQVFIKRDDELSCGVSGSKYRKYSSIIPNLLKQKIQHVYVIGSTHSNNVLAAMQMLRENKFKITALLLKSHNHRYHGNFKLSKLFIKDKDIIWIDRADWPNVNEIALKESIKNNLTSFILTEGASVIEGIVGAKTLAIDILKNELEQGVKFDHVFLDSGTGFSASCCIKELEDSHHKAQCHILLLAGSQEEFIEKNKRLSNAKLTNTTFFTPSNAKSFGSINQTLKKFIYTFAYQQGVLVDPIYSGKLFYESEKYINENTIRGNILIIHSGGVLTLPNFDLT